MGKWAKKSMLNEPTQSSKTLCGETQAKQSKKYHTVAQPKDKPAKFGESLNQTKASL